MNLIFITVNKYDIVCILNLPTGMYLQVREYVLGCEECKLRKTDRQEVRPKDFRKLFCCGCITPCDILILKE